MTFRDQPAVSDFDGTVNWFRPALIRIFHAPSAFRADYEICELTSSKIFGNGFTTQNILIGSDYSSSGKAPVLAVPQREGNVVVNLANGDLENDLQEMATLEPNNQFVVTPSDTAKLRLSISGASGELKGSFIHPVTRRNTSHRGVVFQKQNLAQGYFLGTGQSGLVSVVPANELVQLGTSKTSLGAAGPVSNPGATPAE